MLMSVSTSTLPRAGTVVGRDAYRSYPAANSLPRVGVLAFSESFLIRRGGVSSTLVTAGPLLVDDDMVVDVVAVLTLFAGGDVGGDVICSKAVVIFF